MKRPDTPKQLRAQSFFKGPDGVVRVTARSYIYAVNMSCGSHN